MRILFQIRENAFSQRGGDTVDIERISAGLQSLGVRSEIDCNLAVNPKDFDLVFLVNFTLPQLLQQQAHKAVQAQVPFVVLALNEDIPSFHNQSHRAAAELMSYVRNNQPHRQFSRDYPNVWNTNPVNRFENEWVARNAAMIFATGEREAKVINANYPGLQNVRNIELGFDPMVTGSAERFYQEFGVKDFILCVGRIESRKNQLMLLKAMERESHTIVLAAGGFTYQPDYDQAVRAFKRDGQTLILGKLSQQQLSDAYAASKIHVLPSWYELPGLVSMEAASIGKNVVVTDMGTTRDYFEDHALYCDPASPESVKNATLAAWYSEPKAATSEHIRAFNWTRTAEQVLKHLQELVPASKASLFNMGAATQVPSIKQVVEKAEEIARTGDFSTALNFVRESKATNQSSSALWRAEGMLLIAMQNYGEAENALSVAYSIDPKDSKVVCGLAICARQRGLNEKTEDLLLHALDLDGGNKVALLQLMGVSYELNSFESLESCLKQFLSLNPQENDLRYALAGCLYKQQKLEQAEDYCEQVLSLNPQHNGATELKEIIFKDLALLKEKVAQPVSATPVALSQTDLNQYSRIAEISELKRINQMPEALRQVTSLIGDMAVNSPALEEAYCLQGELLALNGQLFEAERRFNAILVQYPESFKAYCGLGAIQGEKANWMMADESFRKALSINPNCDTAFAGLAMSSLASGDREAAWHYYEKSLETNPENLRAIYGIMELGYPQGRYQDIEKALKNYLDCHPANLELLYSLAGCLFAQNRLSEASSEVDKILILKPGDSKAAELKDVIAQKLAGR
jgi:Flp pilus assembly protein TadD/glycosyltransferase involved in cell wall biosynthesis